MECGDTATPRPRNPPERDSVPITRGWLGPEPIGMAVDKHGMRTTRERGKLYHIRSSNLSLLRIMKELYVTLLTL
jgi:hypothetical protein